MTTNSSSNSLKKNNECYLLYTTPIIEVKKKLYCLPVTFGLSSWSQALDFTVGQQINEKCNIDHLANFGRLADSGLKVGIYSVYFVQFHFLT